MSKIISTLHTVPAGAWIEKHTKTARVKWGGVGPEVSVFHDCMKDLFSIGYTTGDISEDDLKNDYCGAQYTLDWCHVSIVDRLMRMDLDKALISFRKELF